MVSVVVPIYRVEKYLRKCVDSLLQQTYKNIEIILVDDGSPDACPEICDELKKTDDRIVVIHKKNGGLSDARNAGIQIANGTYITFIDSDDYVGIHYIENKILNTYAAYAFDDLIRKQSSSGAIFSLIAEKILSLSGIVYGVTMTDDCKGAEFVRVDNIEQLHLLRGSKYIQAKVGQAYKSVKNDLNSGRIVLFSGTGCQNNGLKKYLGKDYENLYCIDVVCHGVPSPKLWRHYLEHIETINNAKIIGVNFRCKDQGWKNFGMEEIQHDKKKVYIPSSQDSFMRMFLRNYCLRPSCYECEAKLVRCADLTLADFWGINFVAPEMNDNKGVSLVIIRSQRGQSLFDTIQEKLCYKKVDYNAAIKYNPSEITSAPRPKERNKFFSDLEKKEFIKMEKKYAADAKIPLKQKVKNILRNALLRKNNGGGTVM